MVVTGAAHRGGAKERTAPTKRRPRVAAISCDALAAPDSVTLDRGGALLAQPACGISVRRGARICPPSYGTPSRHIAKRMPARRGRRVAVVALARRLAAI